MTAEDCYFAVRYYRIPSGSPNIKDQEDQQIGKIKSDINGKRFGAVLAGITPPSR